MQFNEDYIFIFVLLVLFVIGGLLLTTVERFDREQKPSIFDRKSSDASVASAAIDASVISGGKRLVIKDISDQSHFEKSVRSEFEKVFNEKFPSVYLPWMKSPEGTVMELDGYCDKLKIAFEAQGPQHFHFLPKFDKTMEEFRKRIRNDALKKKLCEEHGVKLIIIDCRIPFLRIKRFIFSLRNNR